jgi:hypothetical protein
VSPPTPDDTPRSQPDYLTAADLADIGLAPGDVPRRCPWAVEYVALDGSPCWCAEDLEALVSRTRGGDLP